jgi:hypothetical protein
MEVVMKKFEYKPYIKSLVEYMLENGYTKKPLPKVKLNRQKQEGLFINTGRYIHSMNLVELFLDGRHPKDVLRSLAHELIHHKQFLDGRITDDMCEESEITKNDLILPFEEEAYLKGNIAFRTWTELEKNKKS